MSTDSSTSEAGSEKPTVPMLRRLELKNFRSVAAAEIEWFNPTFLVGGNGSGKSSIVDAFAFLADAMNGSLQAALERHGGISAMRHRISEKTRHPSFELDLVLTDLDEGVKEARYAVKIGALGDEGFQVVRELCIVMQNRRRHFFIRDPGGAFKSNVKDLKPGMAPDALLLPLMGGDSRFRPVHRFLSAMRTYCIDPHALRGMQDQTDGAFLRRDGSNAASVLRELEERSDPNWERIQQLLGRIAPEGTRVRPVQHGNKLTLEFTQDFGKEAPVVFDARDMSDGTLRAMGLLAAVFQKPAPSVLLIEEPENTMHPDALGVFLDLFHDAERSMQLIVSTHSADILDAKWIDDRHLKLILWDEGQTRVSLVSEPTRLSLREGPWGAGDMLRSNALTAEGEEEPFPYYNLQIFLEDRIQ